MIDPQTLGRRIKYFRKRSGMSQMELEMEIGASAGMISRIEKGKVNPSKETINRIGSTLSIHDKELDYLIGPLSVPANQKEIDLAIDEVKEYFDRSMTFGYLIDDRFRLLYISKGFEKMFRKLLSNYDEVYKELIGNSIVRLIFDDDLGVNKFLDRDSYDELVYYQLARVKKQILHMFDDEYYIQAEKSIRKYPKIQKLWDSIDNLEVNFNSLESKRVEFKISGIKVETYFSRESVWKYPRFETIEYIPSNRFLRLVKGLMG